MEDFLKIPPLTLSSPFDPQSTCNTLTFNTFDFDFAKTKLWLLIHKIWNTSCVSKYLQDFWLSTCQNKTLTINTFKMNIEHTQNIFHIAFGILCSWMRNNVVKVGIGTLNIPNFKVLYVSKCGKYYRSWKGDGNEEQGLDKIYMQKPHHTFFSFQKGNRDLYPKDNKRWIHKSSKIYFSSSQGSHNL